MEDPFQRNDGRYPRHPFSQSSTFGGDTPVYPFDLYPETHRTGCSERSQGARVFQIPVHFVGSDRPGSALKVQKVFRGFMVRKCLKKIKGIKAQVDEIEERLSKGEVMELVRKDSKERLRVNEDLMSLLFKLDSICGVDFGVRSCRKAVIRKAIALQEKVDAIVAGDYDWEVVSNGVPENEGNLGRDDDGGVEIIDVGVDHEVKVISEEDCENRRNEDKLERIIEANEKMMRLMTQFLERNETQSKMISALVDRVELLEKAFLCDARQRNKKPTEKRVAEKKVAVSYC